MSKPRPQKIILFGDAPNVLDDAKAIRAEGHTPMVRTVSRWRGDLEKADRVVLYEAREDLIEALEGADYTVEMRDDMGDVAEWFGTPEKVEGDERGPDGDTKKDALPPQPQSDATVSEVDEHGKVTKTKSTPKTLTKPKKGARRPATSVKKAKENAGK